MASWDAVEHEDIINLIDWTWAFKFKQIQMEQLRNTKLALMIMVINRWKRLISLWSMPQLSCWPLFDSCLSLKTYLIWSQSKLISLQPPIVLLLEKMKKSMLKCLLVSSFKQQGFNKNTRFFISRKPFIVCVQVLVSSGSISLRSFKTVTFFKLHWILPLYW